VNPEQPTTAPTTEAPKDRHVLTGALFRRRSARVTLSETPPLPKPEPVRRPAKVARMLALAHHLQGAVDQASSPTGRPSRASSGSRGRG